jgi:cytochrome c-type biogenesis protein
VVLASVSETVSGVVLTGPLLFAMVLAAAAGALSFFSPCCLPLVPGYLSYITGVAQPGRPGARGVAVVRPVGVGAGATPSGKPRGSAAAGVSLGSPSAGPAGYGPAPGVGRFAPGGSLHLVLAALLFVLGFAAVFTSYGALFGGLGTLLLSQQALLVRVLGVFTILMGLVFAGVLQRLRLLGRTFRLGYRPRAGLAGAPLVGALFGLGWTPCIGPTLAAVLTLATSTGDAGRGAVLSFAYSLGLGIPFLLAAAGLGRALPAFGWARRHGQRITQVGGAFLVVLGLLQVSGLWTDLISRLQGSIAGFTVPL